jgi:hypothetical protein
MAGTTDSSAERKACQKENDHTPQIAIVPEWRQIALWRV